ncbi:MAG: alpha/beta hydrolase [Candidatus Pelethousia sp.]|nr:alpha/beta hydrolase [Candidatus Pelethousia sp.]
MNEKELSSKSWTSSFFRKQLKKLQSFTEDEPLAAERRAQDFIGVLLQKIQHPDVRFCPLAFDRFQAAMALPSSLDCSGAVLYLHGGGYCCGGIEYAKGFGATLATEGGIRVLCPAYRLAPEHPFPAALDDAMAAYRFLLEEYDPSKIVLVGESAGGGLIFSVCLAAKKLGLPLPAGLVGISPWTDLTASGKSYAENEFVDPSMSLRRLQFFASCYTDEPANPLSSPLFGDLLDFPESLLFVGGDEIMRDDAVQLYEKLLASGCKSALTVAPAMWHVYVLYGMKDRRQDMDAICAFIRGLAQ